MEHKLSILGGFIPIALFVAVSAAQVTPTLANEPSKVPSLKAELDGARTAVFETPQDSCNQYDIPDAMARAFRDYTGTVHFVAASSEMFQSLGPSLDNVTHSCEAAHHSANDPNPADYNDQTWLDSFYTEDGKAIAALTHTEYHGWAHPGECHSQNFNECEYDSDTYHFSKDGGYHFDSAKAPANLVAEVPFKYVVDEGPIGYSVDSNVVQYGGWYYAVVTDDGTAPLPRAVRRGAYPYQQRFRSIVVARLEWKRFFCLICGPLPRPGFACSRSRLHTRSLHVCRERSECLSAGERGGRYSVGLLG
jgi:hypothetical protein